MIYARVIKYHHNVDTDVIIPARYLNIQDKKELAKHCFEDVDKAFLKKLTDNKKIIVAGNNFGCGSSREQAPLSLKEAGILCIIAVSFARIFYRNCINIGLPLFISEKLYNETDEGDYLKIDEQKGIIVNETKNRYYNVEALPEFIQRIIAAGGLINYIKDDK